MKMVPRYQENYGRFEIRTLDCTLFQNNNFSLERPLQKAEQGLKRETDYVQERFY